MKRPTLLVSGNAGPTEQPCLRRCGNMTDEIVVGRRTFYEYDPWVQVETSVFSVTVTGGKLLLRFAKRYVDGSSVGARPSRARNTFVPRR